MALVIGNSAYKVGPLANPGNDAQAIAAALQRLGFEVVLRNDLGYTGMIQALRAFAPKATGADIAVVYFAGHGTEHGGRNFLLPIDAVLARASDLDVEAIPLDTVLSQIGGASRLRLVILDACRNSIFPLAGAKRSATRGLARVEPEDNTLVAFAAKEGTLADDGEGSRNSPFTAALLKHVAIPDLDVRLMLGKVRDDVLRATDRQQQPHVYGTLGGEAIYLASATGTAASALLPSVPSPMTDNSVADLLTAVEGMSDRKRLEAFAKHRNASVAKAAAARLAALAATVPSPAPALPTPAIAPTVLPRVLPLPEPRLACSQERALKSGRGNPTSITFVNATDEAMQIFWIDFDGRRKFYASLQSGESYLQPTYVTHPWVVVDTSGQCRGLFEPAESPITVTVR